MKLYIGENLKKQRKLRELTQEQLAQILGVSFQSVSKWERNEGYPDIEFLPTIANYFGITVDELMGMDAIRDDSDVEKILTQVDENASKGLIEENIALLESAAKRFPNHYKILERYADSLTFVNWDIDGEPYRQNCQKAIAISERILAECTDKAIRDVTQTKLCYYYQRAGQHEKALEAVRKLPNLWETYEIVGENILEDEELLNLQQSNILSLTELLYMTLTLMSLEGNPAYTPEEKIRIKKKVVAVYDLIFEKGDLNFYAHNLSYVYRQIAMIAISEGDRALALESLEKSADYAIENDLLPDEKPYTSLAVNRMRHNTKNTITNLKISYSEEMLQHLASEKYDAIRDEPRFHAIEKRLSELRPS
ncbi:MAG: helix-turn-helix domain-containing protein [Bacteroides sp.]|nr:helix-turn-helix domain-containing protein [Eubacterium sp.]MCM1418075.1 helix-turn-helix domain-containing protein [Roseburia sp.]MCM1462219.1 helix-turn-helix domain-containing protein [Bacteroides sp.]